MVQWGHNREACFFADEDYLFYLHWLKEGSRKYGCAIHAYVLMTNHVHLLMTPARPDGISRLMQSLNRRYAQYVNRIYRRSGSVWEGRFKASLIQADEYLRTCYRYIELNPVRAGMVSDPGEYRWSSYRWHGLGRADEVVTDHALYLDIAGDEEERRAAYRGLFRVQLDEEALGEIRKVTNRGLPLGGERFREQVEAAPRRRVGLRRRGRREKEHSATPVPGQMGLDL